MIDEALLTRCYEDVLEKIRSTRKRSAKGEECFWDDTEKNKEMKECLMAFLSSEGCTLESAMLYYKDILKKDETEKLSTPERVRLQVFFLTVSSYFGGECKVVQQNTEKNPSKAVCANVLPIISARHGKAPPPQSQTAEPEKDDGTTYLCNFPFCKMYVNSKCYKYVTPQCKKTDFYYCDNKNKKNFFRHIGTHFVCMEPSHGEHYSKDLRQLRALFPTFVLAVSKDGTLQKADLDAPLLTPASGAWNEAMRKEVGQNSFFEGDRIHVINPNFDFLGDE